MFCCCYLVLSLFGLHNLEIRGSEVISGFLLSQDDVVKQFGISPQMDWALRMKQLSLLNKICSLLPLFYLLLYSCLGLSTRLGSCSLRLGLTFIILKRLSISFPQEIKHAIMSDVMVKWHPKLGHGPLFPESYVPQIYMAHNKNVKKGL